MASELKKKLWNKNVKVILFVIGGLGTITERLVWWQELLEIEEQNNTIQTIVLLRSARILIIVLVKWTDLLSLKLQWKTII